MTLQIIDDADGTTVKVGGDVDLESKAVLEHAIGRLGDQPRQLVIDLRDVTFLDSVGLGLLAHVHQQTEANGGSLTVRAPSPIVERMLAVSGLLDYLTVVDG